MADTHYGDTVLIEALSDSTTSTKLKRVSFVKGESGEHYNEAWLQNLIMTHPGMLPVSQVEPVFESMVPVCREMPLRNGFVDNLFVTPKGDIALVECKLWRNPESRRKVVAQIIDYASELSTLSYEQFEAAVLRAQLASGAKSSLFDMVAAEKNGDEAAFHDAVSRTLSRGKFLLIIVGDGIQEGLEAMAAFLQQHAGLHFTMCLVELALFALPKGGFVAQPRILGRTVNIQRGVITLSDSRLRLSAPEPLSGQSSPQLPMSISSENFYEKLDAAQPGVAGKLQQLFVQLEPLGIKPDYREKTVTLRWLTDQASWNLGTVTNDGALWLDYHVQQAKNLNLSDKSLTYLQSLAAVVPGVEVVLSPKGGSWNLRGPRSNSLVVTGFLSESGRQTWLQAITEFQKAVRDLEA